MIDYYELAQLVDNLLEISGDSVEALADILDDLDPETRNELLVSDLLNAYQTFYYYFRESPGDLAEERLILHPASELATGILIDEVDDCEVIAAVRESLPIIAISDGDRIVARFTGQNAYREAVRFLEESG
ncbi:MAG: hypothetical protein KO206_02815 [Methanomicrobiaceae archaeon]|uniref:Uncharacterized protein n=1 Tax=hydrocarbon metagenome TaxID=938273 RepID=A0A0W8FKE6_9ZZZZ|nr:hypothetical protein [Methanomicrobiaceae archaeon]MDD5419865.1 hypothetical protein [Methanomicrobiaceae archaeon]